MMFWEGIWNSFSFSTAFASFTLLALFIFGCDDLFVDLTYWFKRLGPQKLNADQCARIVQLPQKRLAVLIPAWHEYDILESMIRGNLERLKYSAYDIFLGVYPNDERTLQVARRLQTKSVRVHVIVNTQDGPTSKGQMLNEMFREVAAFGQYEIYVLQDAEDVIHPYAFHVFNHYIESADFLQIPVFSLPVSVWSWVRGTYVDEFSESHSKDLFVRQYWGASLPSAGVGTALNARFVDNLLWMRGGQVLNEKTLTEDYQLGVEAAGYGLVTRFVNVLWTRDNGGISQVATREYFPSGLRASIRQKTRWTLGIVYQGMENIRWAGHWSQKYFLWRDRKGPLAQIALIMAYAMSLQWTIGYWQNDLPSWATHSILTFLAYANLFFLLNRVFHRVLLTKWIYGWKLALTSPLRMLLSNLVNVCAAIQSTRQYTKSKWTGRAPKWVKTQHELPAAFGQKLSITKEVGL